MPVTGHSEPRATPGLRSTRPLQPPRMKPGWVPAKPQPGARPEPRPRTSARRAFLTGAGSAMALALPPVGGPGEAELWEAPRNLPRLAASRPAQPCRPSLRAVHAGTRARFPPHPPHSAPCGPEETASAAGAALAELGALAAAVSVAGHLALPGGGGGGKGNAKRRGLRPRRAERHWRGRDRWWEFIWHR